MENPFAESRTKEGFAKILEAVKDFCDDCPLRLEKCANCYLDSVRRQAEEEL